MPVSDLGAKLRDSARRGSQPRNILYQLGDSVTVRAPATSANLGCGFDAFGIALDLWLTLTVTVSTTFSFRFRGDVDPDLPTDGTNAIVLAFLVGLRHLRALPPSDVNFEYICENDIPIGRGLGSSGSAIVAGVGAAFAICGKSLDRPEVLKEMSILACRREGHPDNVLPAIFGEMQIGVIRTSEDVRLCLESEISGIGDYIVQKVAWPLEDITCLVYVPNDRLSTAAARRLIPEQYSKADAVSNVGRVGILVAALLMREYENLKFAVEDRMHQPYRAHLCPAYETLKNASPVTDALAVYLSGAGPSVVVWCRTDYADDVIEDFRRLCGSHLDTEGHFKKLHVSARGVHTTAQKSRELRMCDI